MVKSKEQPPPRGVYAALATPRSSGSTEASAAVLLDYLETVVRTGVEGLVLFGSTGEFIHFDVAERMRVLTLAIRRSRVPVLVNVSHSTLAGAVDLAENAVNAGAAGVLLMPPYFYHYTDAQIAEFYQLFAISMRDRIPIYLYNLPAFTNAISAELASRLLESRAFAGIKDSSGDRQLFTTLKDLREAVPFTLLVGSESLYLECRLAGADGIVSGVAAAIPELIVAIDRALRVNDGERALQLNRHLEEFVGWVDRFPASIAIKQAAVARGWNLNHFAFPFDEDTQADLAAFHHWLHTWLPPILSDCQEQTAARA